VTVTEGSVTAAAAVSLRIFALAVPGVVLLMSTDPTDLADALAQRARLPHRFVLAALAATRLVGVMAQEWRTLAMARRARGLGEDGVWGRAATAAGQVFTLLVLAVRRATTLATAMEARGFGVRAERTWARPSQIGRADLLVAVGGVAIAVAATVAGLAAGTWRLVLLGQA
jgi:energy-coupling factor transport system permease protein